MTGEASCRSRAAARRANGPFRCPMRAAAKTPTLCRRRTGRDSGGALDDRAPETLCNRATVVVRQCADQSGEAPGWPSIKPRGTTRRCQDTFLRNVLDDNAVGACGRCDNCMGNQYDATTDQGRWADPQLHQAAANHHRASEGVGGPVTCSSQAEPLCASRIAKSATSRRVGSRLGRNTGSIRAAARGSNRLVIETFCLRNTGQIANVIQPLVDHPMSYLSAAHAAPTM